MRTLEAEIRAGVGTLSPLPWDNEDQRLGREGPGVPGTRPKRKLRDKGHRWDGEK